MIAGAAGLAGALAFALKLRGSAKPAAWIPVITLAVVSLLAPVTRLYAQLLARGVWWSNLVLGVLLSVMGSRNERSLGVALTLGCAVALLVADRRALLASTEGAGFRPVAYAGTIQLLLVLALADAQTLGLFAIIEHGRPHEGAWVALGLASVAMITGFFGLLRLSLWGVFLTMGTALSLGLALVTESVRPDRDIVKAMLALAAMQVAVPLPMLLSMLTRRPLPAPPARLRGALANALIALIAAAAAASALGRR